MSRDTKPPAPLLAQFLLLAATWGSSFLFVAVGLEGLSPTQVVLARLVLGAAALAVIMAVTRRPLPRDPTLWAHLAVVALLLCVVPFLLFAWAQQQISSGLASIYNATTPLLTMLVALLALSDERPTQTRLTGLLLGFAGVLVVLGPWRGVGPDTGLAGQAACLAATTCYGAAFVYLRRYVSGRGYDAPTLAFGQVAVGAAVMLLAAPWIASQPVQLSGRVVASTLLLGVAGTGLAYVWNNNIVAGWGATNASTVTYVTPLVGVLLGVVVLGERLTWNQPLGAVLVLVGIAVGQGRLRARRARSSPRADVRG